jgi:hypothetical protein
VDIISHGLWGAAPSYAKGKRSSWWLAFLFGVMPDAVSFGWTFVMAIFVEGGFKMGDRPHSMENIPSLTFTLYNITHSLFIFVIVFGAVYLLRKRKLFWPLAAWGLHIIMDIPTHSFEFFPTPFLWPVSQFKVDGISWGQPWFMAVDISALLVVYLILYVRRKKRAAR